MMELLIKLLIVLACSVLWSLGGSTFPKIKGDSLYRKIGIPIVLGLYVALTFAPFWIGVLYGLAVMGLLTVSYGLNDLTHTITGYIFKLIGYPNSQVDSGNCRPCEIATRALAGFLWSLASIVLAVAGTIINRSAH